MTDKEKLQKLFDAALRAPSTGEGAPKRAVPATPAASCPAPELGRILSPARAAAPIAAAPEPAVVQAAPQGEDELAEPCAAPTMGAVLDDAASAELGALLDEQIRRKKRQHRIESLVAAVVFFSLTGGGFAWFVQSPERVQAFTSAMREIRSVGDVKSLVAKYQAALERISTRGQQIDQASAAMGAVVTAEDERDPYLDAEMKSMMGGKGKTIGERGKQMKEAFGDMEREHGQALKTAVALKKDESFEWNH
jgi:hypothetical protein